MQNHILEQVRRSHFSVQPSPSGPARVRLPHLANNFLSHEISGTKPVFAVYLKFISNWAPCTHGARVHPQEHPFERPPPILPRCPLPQPTTLRPGPCSPRPAPALGPLHFLSPFLDLLPPDTAKAPSLMSLCRCLNVARR